MSETDGNPKPQTGETAEPEAQGLSEAPEAAEIETPQAQISRLEEQAADLKDKLLRAMADQENARSRHARELEDARKYAATGFARDLLDVVDNLGRALQAVPEGERGGNKLLDDLCVGVEMTQRTLLNAFDKHNIKQVVPAKGDKFDHRLHQAMFEVPSSELAPGHIADVMQAGYTIAGRLLRAAMVGVTKAAPAQEPAAEQPPPGSKIDTSA